MAILRYFSTSLTIVLLPAVFTVEAAPTIYTDEQSYLNALALTEYDTAHEGFETGQWENVRSPSLSSSVTNNSVTWALIGTPGTSQGLTTGSNDYHDPIFEMYTLDFSQFPTITHVIPDGYTLTTGFKLYGVGGWFRSPDGAKLSFTLDKATAPAVVDFAGAEATITNWTFLGFIEPNGFNSLEIRVSDEIIEPRTFFSDDFNLAASPGSFVDSDGDGISDLVDNCPAIANANQADNDNDGSGDVCDSDDDNDTVLDSLDNCPLMANTDQADIDGDGIGDVCDSLSDSDGDSIADSVDNCPVDANPNQTDTDGDGIGDVCDPLTDSDGDGVADGSDNCPAIANANQADNDNDGSGDVCDSDDDNDTVLDAFDNCPLIVNTDQADTDGDGIGDVCDDLTGTLPVITIPENYLHIVVDSTGVLTSVDLGDVTASDLEDPDLTLSADLTGPFVPGHHIITWTVTDRDGNTVTAEQIVDVIPLVTFGSDLLAEAGSTVTVTAYLNGNAANYPVNIQYTIDGVAASLPLEIPAGTEGSFIHNIPGNAVGQITLSMSSAINAVRGEKSQLTIQIVEGQVAPIAKIHARQAGQLVRTVYGDNGPVVITADVVDSNNADNHTLDWRHSDSAILAVARFIGNQLIIDDPSTLSAVSHHIRVVVSDDGVPAASTSADLLLNFVLTQPVLSTTGDSDGDGVFDADDGLDDEDEDGIPDYLDAISAIEVLPCIQGVDSDYLMSAESGLNLRLGSMAFVTESGSADITSVIQDYINQTPELEADPVDAYSHAGGIFDFEITGLSYPGQSARVVISLLDSIPAGAVYRKYTTANGWRDFVVDGNNSIASAPGQAGVCPAHGDPSYVSGLTGGDYCIQLTLQDGGVNDEDGEANGSITDPGGVAVQTMPAVSSSGGGGGSISYIFYLVLIIVLYFRIVAGPLVVIRNY